MAGAHSSNGKLKAASLRGTLIADTYRVEEVLGEGGMGVVVGARHEQLGERVALKFLLDGGDAQAHERLLREARAAMRIKSEHAVRVLDVKPLSEGSCCLVMEYLEGHSLRDELNARGALPVAEAVEYVVQACEALAEAHGKGIVHRDIKPSNLFLTRRNDGSPLVKVLDFGIAKLAGAGDSELTHSTDMMGSPHYMAPEQIQSSRHATPRVDVWSLGVTLFELLANARPFAAEPSSAVLIKIVNDPTPSLAALRPGLDASLIEVVQSCLLKDPRKRLPSVVALAEALLPFCASPYATLLVERLRRLPPATIDEPRSWGPVASSRDGDDTRSSTSWSDGPARHEPPAGSPARLRRPVAVALVGALALGGLYLAQRSGPRADLPAGPASTILPEPSATASPAATTPGSATAGPAAGSAAPGASASAPTRAAGSAAASSSVAASASAARAAPVRRPGAPAGEKGGVFILDSRK